MNQPKIYLPNKGIGGLLEGFSPNNEIEKMIEKEKMNENFKLNVPKDHWNDF